MTSLFLGLNALDLALTAIALTMGGHEGGWYAFFGLNQIWQIIFGKIVLVVVFLLVVHFWKMKRFIKYGNIVLVIVCLANTASIFLMWRLR